MKWWPFAKQPLPEVRPGRESVPDDSINGVIGTLTGFYSFASAPFSLHAYELLERLGMYNPDVSQALSIWVNLGNTGHQVEVEARNAQAVLDRLNDLAASVYPTGGGVDGLVNHFLRQIPLMGALSAEWVVSDRIQEGLVDCAVVPVKRIRWQRINGQWAPFQVTNAISGGNMGYVALNPVTYSCMPLITNDGSPYPIPPFLACLKNVEVQIDATKNIASIIRKMGLLGFIDVSMDIPEKKPGESDDLYAARLTNRLQAYAKAYQKGVAQGVSVHYKDQEIKHNATNAGAAGGANSVWQLNEEQIFSALDIPPSMCGRSYSSTETYAAVDFERLGTKLVNAKRMVKRFLEKGYTLDLLLRGIDARVSVCFNQGSTFREKEKAEKEGLEIKNVLAKRDGGLIDTDQAAQELGYEKATGYRVGDPAAAGISGDVKRFAFNRIANRYEFVREKIVLLETPADDRIDQSYQAALESVLAPCEATAITAAIAKAEWYTSSSNTGRRNPEYFAQVVYGAFAKTLRTAIAATSIMRVCKRFTGAEWQRWRYEDKNHLSTRRLQTGLTSPTGPTGLKVDIAVVDKNAIRYITNVEEFYFGRGNYLANDEVAGKQFITWLQDEYISKGLNIRDEATWKEFKTQFKGLVEQTSYQKIEQLVSTTMGRIQNMGQTMSLYEAGVKRYQIVGPRTAPICAYCKSMLGRIFDVQVAATRLATVLDKGFEKPDDLPPFLSSKYPVERVQEMTDEELQTAGYETPPFHPKCRHRKAAVD